jgi:hypothetical protein
MRLAHALGFAALAATAPTWLGCAAGGAGAMPLARRLVPTLGLSVELPESCPISYDYYAPDPSKERRLGSCSGHERYPSVDVFMLPAGETRSVESVGESVLRKVGWACPAIDVQDIVPPKVVARGTLKGAVGPVRYLERECPPFAGLPALRSRLYLALLGDELAVLYCGLSEELGDEQRPVCDAIATSLRPGGDVADVLRRHDDVLSCYVGSVLEKLGEATAVEITFSVDASGHVIGKPRVKTDKMALPVFEQCLSESVSKLAFPAASGRPAEYRMPLYFERR